MGHKRTNPTPSPIKMLAIHHAHATGMSLSDISKRTKHSVSSIMRWNRLHGHEVQFMEIMLHAFPDLKQSITLDAFYPAGINNPNPV